MKSWLRTALVLIAVSMAAHAQSAHAQSAHAQSAPVQSAPVQSAPIPPPLLTAHTLFLSNAGSDAGLFPHPFTGAQSRPYDQLYNALTSWNRYTLADSPSSADLIFEIQLIAPNGPSSGNKVNGASDPLPMFRLTLYDRPSHVILWTQTSSIAPANMQKTHDKNFDDALNQLVTDLKAVLAK